MASLANAIFFFFLKRQQDYEGCLCFESFHKEAMSCFGTGEFRTRCLIFIKVLRLLLYVCSSSALIAAFTFSRSIDPSCVQCPHHSHLSPREFLKVKRWNLPNSICQDKSCMFQEKKKKKRKPWSTISVPKDLYPLQVIFLDYARWSISSSNVLLCPRYTAFSTWLAFTFVYLYLLFLSILQF